MPSPADVQNLLKKHGAIQEGHFVLASGKHSEFYVQTAQLMKEPSLVDELLEDFRDDLSEAFGAVDTILTAATGGITFAQQVGLILRTTTIFAERNDSNELELNRGFQLRENESVLLVEDVVTTGGTLTELNELVEENHATTLGVYTMINRSGMTDWHGRPFLSVLSVDYPVYSPDSCPACSDATDAVRPGTKEVTD